MTTELPATDLERLQEEILSKSADAALPSQLSDFWLNSIARDLEVLDCELGSRDPAVLHALTGPLALIVHILVGKSNSMTATVSQDDLVRFFHDYRMEIALEQVSRSTRTQMSPATLETIFTNRDVEVRDH
ncbi:hypothetical protein [Pseudoxanthomonas sp. X-1]|uniref:hypothetical protein n=1 Tax=Pseudoxanthomonas sp. X-1 TaxID=2571115 RepID=UPI00110AE4D2|nr:hypothetical protein [Pseudoxanthomonas sp. X-1]TMN16129.1 hypothetical protein FF950_19100 [Pseudoxanthomonas sp. X-1]UAY73593.1 hypothetical protein LAJ50_13965 [Pseudoxanthomonas sp. X-1]